MRRAARLALLTAFGCVYLGQAGPAAGQEVATSATGGEEVATLERASALRDSLERPPGKPPFDAADAIGLPFKIAFLPLRLVALGHAELIGFAAKLAVPREYGPLERIVEAGFRPAFGSISPRSGMAAGVRVVRFNPLYAETAYSVRGSQRHGIGLDIDREGFRLETAYFFQRYAEPHFYGIGPGSREGDESDYLLDRQSISLLGTLKGRSLTLNGGIGYQDNRVGRGFDDSTSDLQEVFADELPYGVDERTEYLFLDLSATLNQTHVNGHQRRGLLFELGSALFQGTDGTDSDFYQVRGALNGYLPLNPRQQLALRGISEINRGSGRGVPFTHLASLGGSRAGRAYPPDRFRDRDLLALMSEWRYEIWRELHERGRAEGFLLLDAGAVDSQISEISTSDLLWSYGFGFRMVWSGQLRWLMYLAFGDEGARLDTDFTWAF